MIRTHTLYPDLIKAAQLSQWWGHGAYHREGRRRVRVEQTELCSLRERQAPSRIFTRDSFQLLIIEANTRRDQIIRGRRQSDS